MNYWKQTVNDGEYHKKKNNHTASPDEAYPAILEFTSPRKNKPASEQDSQSNFQFPQNTKFILGDV